MLDTNAIIALLQGNDFLKKELEKAEYICVSFISVIEFLSFPSLSSHDKEIFNKFIEKVYIVSPPLTDIIALDTVAVYKKLSGLKLPDVIIAISAIDNEATLVTNDKDFNKVPKLKLLTFDLP